MRTYRKDLLVGSILGLLLIAPASTGQSSSSEDGPQPTVEGKFGSGVSESARHTIMNLYSLVGLDTERGVLTKAFDEDALDQVIGRLDDPDAAVAEQAFMLLEKLVKQLEIPTTTIQKVIMPAVSKAEGQYKTSSRRDEQRLYELTERIVWQVHVKGLSGPEERVEFLASQLDNKTEGYYYRFEAIDYLADMGTPAAKAALTRKLEESRSRSMSEKLKERLIAGIEKVEVRIHLIGAPRDQQVVMLLNALNLHGEDRSSAWTDFKVWTVRRLGELLPEAVDPLREIARDGREYGEQCRVEARAALAHAE